LVDIGEHPGLLMWMLLAVPGGFGAIFATPDSYNNLLIAFLAVDIAALIFVFILPLRADWYHAVTENASDWDQNADFTDTDDTRRNFVLMLGGLALVFVMSLGLGWFFSGGELKVAFWIPTLSLDPTVFMSLLIAILITIFCVIPGEEGLKIMFMPVNKVFPDLNLPFCFQPGRIAGNSFWSVFHVFFLQAPLTFAISVFVAACIMDTISAQAGTILPNYYIHGLFNVLLIVATFVMGGALTLIWN